jgi:hypothetical protein
VARVNIFIGEDLLEKVDEEARLRNVNRSALFRDALTEYLESRKKAREEEEARLRMERSCRRMDAIADRLGAWDPTPIIRRFRDARRDTVVRTGGRGRGRGKK